MSYNGNLIPRYVAELYRELYDRGYCNDFMQRDSWVDTELIVKAIECSEEDSFEKAIIDVCKKLRGAFSLLFLCDGALYAIRDTYGFRPLEIGHNQYGYLVASEDNIFEKFPGGRKIRSVEPGECVIFSKMGNSVSMSSYFFAASSSTHFCQFEQVYFSRMDSTLGGERVFLQQEKLGRMLAKECPPPVNVDIVLGVPDSGIGAAYGYALETGIRYDQRGLVRIHGGRTFLEPVNDLRRQGVEFKLVAISEFVVDKVVVVVDDSIVRGNVSPRVAHMLKKAGAREVHMRVSSPPIRFGCWYGIDTYRIEKELIAKDLPDVELIRLKINDVIQQRYGERFILDSLDYLSLEGMKSTWRGKEGLCDACWTGNYPVK